MTETQRYLLAVLIVVVDLALFALPLTGLAIAYVLIARPPQFRDWVDELYSDPSSPSR